MENIESILHQTVQDLIDHLSCTATKIKIELERDQRYRVNIETNQPSLLIGHHGETVNALQHLIKQIFWRRYQHELDLNLDVDNYKKRQKENVIDLAERKVELVRKLSSPQKLPAMSPYFRRVVHLHLAQDKFEDIRTESSGTGDQRHIIIKPQLVI